MQDTQNESARMQATQNESARMQATPANPYTVRLHSARLVNAYMGDLHLAGSRRNTQEDRGEERTYKVTVNTGVDPFSLLFAGTIGRLLLPDVDTVVEKVKKTDILEEARIQKARIEEELKKREREFGNETRDMLRQNHELGFLESIGAAAGKLVFDLFSQKTEESAEKNKASDQDGRASAVHEHRQNGSGRVHTSAAGTIRPDKRSATRSAKPSSQSR